MFKHTVSELKEALVCLRAGQVTLPYPFQPHPPEEGFRGLPSLDPAHCVGCGACANACPARLILVSDAGRYRTLDFKLGRCTYCASCRDVCPQQAITMTSQFELSTTMLDDLNIRVQLKLVRCRNCGDVVSTQRMVNLVKEKLDTSDLNMENTAYLDLCLDCKRQAAISTPSLIMEVLP